MSIYSNSPEPDLAALFSDTTEDYLSPAQPDLYRMVEIRLRTGKGDADSCFLVLPNNLFLRMQPVESDGCFTWFAVRFEVTQNPLRYYFEVVSRGCRIRFTRRGVRNTIRSADWWHVIVGFHPPAWAEGAVMYQIFVDRFYNGDRTNDVLPGEYRYLGKPVVRVGDWDLPPSPEGYREFYGGDLQGVIEKLDYLQDLGVEAIYLNPVFLSPSSHKYDTQDYDHIDPHFGRIVHDPEDPGEAGRRRRANRHAGRYLARVTDPANLDASDRLFAALVREAHAHGIRVILDGVFNHCGSFHRWLDAERIYEERPGGQKGARASGKSPYAAYFRFAQDRWPSNGSYDAWWDFETLPKLYYENSEELCESILQVARKWVSPPYLADGWRLDVAADLGYSRSFNHRFWKRFYRAVKEVRSDALILAENYADSRDWLQGGEWDTIMNYEFFLEPVSSFLTGMEKHSDARMEAQYGDPDAFWHAVLYRDLEDMPDAPLRISMNQLSNHDHSRFLTRTNRLVGRVQTLGPEAALAGVHREVMRQAVLLQMTWTGAPTIYYGDEAGQGGFTDPDNRRTYPWGREDRDLLEYHRLLIRLRRESPALRRGSLLRLADGDGILAYARFTKGREAWIILLNINYIPIEYEADVLYAGVPGRAQMETLLQTDREGVRTGLPGIPVRDGRIRLTLPPESGLLLRWRENSGR